jgi:hypothetical protein
VVLERRKTMWGKLTGVLAVMALNAYDQFVGGTGTAVGEVNGNTLSFDLVVSCNLRGDVNKTVGPFDAEFVYDSSTDTLTATDGIVWTRVGS